MQGVRGQNLVQDQEVGRVQHLVREVREVGVLQVNPAGPVGPKVRPQVRTKKYILQTSTRCISVHFGIIKRLRRIIQRKRNIIIIYIHYQSIIVTRVGDI